MNRSIVSLFIALTVATHARAALLVDTGQPPLPKGSYGWSYHSNPLSQVWMAGRFTLPDAATIQSVETYMINLVPGVATWSIYGDGGTVPNVGNRLFTVDFSTGDMAMNVYGWYGVSGLNLDLAAGTYWAAFEANKRDYFYSCIPWGAPDPLSAYAAAGNSEVYGPGSPGSADYALRITGTTHRAVPESLPVGMAIAGTLVFCSALRKRCWRRTAS